MTLRKHFLIYPTIILAKNPGADTDSVREWELKRNNRATSARENVWATPTF